MFDLRLACRLLWRRPLLSLVIVGSLALGIGGAASVFTLLNAVVLRALPVPQADQLWFAEKHTPAGTSTRFSWPQALEARSEIGTRAATAAMSEVTGMQVRSAGGPPGDRATMQLVSGNYFDVLGQRAQVGRLFAEADNREGMPAVAVVSHGYWHRRLDHDPAAVGRTLVINGLAATVVGVAAAGFQGTSTGFRGTDVWLPLVRQPDVKYASNSSSSGAADSTRPWPPQRRIEWLRILLRVPDDEDCAPVASAIEVVLARDASIEAGAPRGPGGRPAPAVALISAARGVSGTRDQLSAPLYVLLAMTGLLLAIASANVASLLLARALNREQEMAVRLSLGAGRSRLVRQLLVESLLLSGVATGVGLLAAAWGRELLLRLFLPAATTVVELDTAFDSGVLFFTAIVGVVTGVACGLAPAIRGTRAHLADTLRLQGRGAVGTSGARALLGRSFIAGQIALCAVLLVVSGLLAASLRQLTHTDVGFDRDHLLAARVDVRSLGLDADARDALARRVIERVRAVPGVASASLSLNGPLSNSSWSSGMVVEGYTARPGERLLTNEEVVTNGYFATVGLELLAGRLFDATDERRDGRTTIVNETMARRFFGTARDAIGRKWGYDAIDSNAFTIVGVVRDAKYRSLRESTPAMAYHPMVTIPDEVFASLEVRTTGNPAAMVPTIERMLRQSMPDLPVVEVVPLEERVSRTAAAERLVAELTRLFSAMALILAAIGLYGTLSYAVSRRTGELGLRLALGADRAAVLRLVMREAVVLVAIGAAIGLPLAAVAARALGKLLFGVPPVDPLIYGTGMLVLVTISLVAAYLPARRAAALDPMAAVREG